MTQNKPALFSTKACVLTIGFLLLAIFIVEFFVLLNQPVNNLGISLEFSDSYFVVNKVVKGSPADKAGINKGKCYKSVNSLTVKDALEFRNSVDEQQYKNHFSNFYKFGQYIELKNTEDQITGFTLEKLNLSQQYANTSLFVKLKFIVASLMLACSLVIVLFLEKDKKILPLVYSIYFISLATVNLFDSEFSSSSYGSMTTILLDIGIYLTFTSIFYYFAQIFSYARKKNLFIVLRFIPISFLLIKYLHTFIFHWNIIDNPLYPINSFFVSLFCIIIICLFVYVVIFFPKTITTTFKFYLIGIVFAITPLLLNHFAYILSHSIFMTEEDKILSTCAFIFLPFMLVLAVLQNKNLLKTTNVAWVTTYFSCIIITLTIFISISDYMKLEKLKHLYYLYVLLIPIGFQLIHKIIIKFFSMDTKDNAKKLESFMQLITPITDTYKLHEVTTKEIVKLLDCSYIFYYKKNEDWDCFYSWGNIKPEEQTKKLNEAKSKSKVTFYKDGSFHIPILRDGKPSGVIYIGPKANGDFYLPGEHVLIVDMIKGFHKHYLMYTNNYLIHELKLKNSKVMQMQEDTIISMANLIESRDGGTGAHVKRTAEYSVLIATRAMEKGLFKEEINEDFINLLNKAAPMHDIGKIVVPDSVLKKPGKLSSEEFESMKLHTTEGEKIVREVLSNAEDEEYISMTSKIAMHHHEKWNGTGYPSGLKADNIPLCARILAIADVFDALVSPRCYKEPMAPDKAFNIIKEDAGKHFDPVLAEIFLELKDEALKIMNQ